MWILYVCVISAASTTGCVIERLLAYPTETSCRVALAGARIENGAKAVEVAKATSVEVTMLQTHQVLMLCRPK